MLIVLLEGNACDHSVVKACVGFLDVERERCALWEVSRSRFLGPGDRRV